MDMESECGSTVVSVSSGQWCAGVAGVGRCAGVAWNMTIDDKSTHTHREREREKERINFRTLRCEMSYRLAVY